MKTLLTRLLIAVALVAAAFSPASAQTALNFTSFSSAVTDPAARAVTLASTTGVSAPTTSAVSYVFAAGELMQVTSVNSTTGLVGVIRGVGGTRAVTHASGEFVYVAPANSTITYDPAGSCTAANQTYLPVINVRNGNVWNCINSSWQGANLTPMAEVRPRVSIAGTAYTILPTDYLVVLSTISNSVATKSFTLPSHVGLAGKQILIKDESGGISATTSIIVVGTIDGTNSATATVVQLKTPFGAVLLEAGSGGWFTLSCHGGNGSQVCR